MGMMTQAQLRPLTEAERRAVELMDSGADIDDVCAETHLSRAQIVAARDLAALWGAVKRSASAPAGPAAAIAEKPVPAPRTAEESEPQDTRPVIAIDLEAAGAEPRYDDQPQPEDESEIEIEAVEEEDAQDPEPIVVGDVTGLLERGRASKNLRARDLALSVDRQLVQLAEILEADERTSAVREEIARLEEALAVKRRELDALLPASRPRPRLDAPFPNGTPKTVLVGGVQVDHRLYYSETVRSWARENGMQVSGSGKMPRSVVEAYVAAFPQAAV